PQVITYRFCVFFPYYFFRCLYLHSFPTRRSSDLILLTSFLKPKKYTRLATPRFTANFSISFFNLPSPISSNLISLGKFINALITDRKSTRLNSSHVSISYAVFCLKK